MNHLGMSFSVNSGQAKFEAKPSSAVRGILKSHGFRWSPRTQVWHTNRVRGLADCFDALCKQLDKDNGIRRPVGNCWTCGNSQGFFRNYGAATPVYCDACEAKHRQA